MAFYTDFFIVIQIMLVMAAMGLFIVSQRHSRIRRSARETHRQGAIFIAALSLLIGLPIFLTSGTAESYEFSLAFFLVVVTLALSALVVRRSYTARGIPKTGGRS